MAKVFGAAAEVYTAKADVLSTPSSFVKDDLAANRQQDRLKCLLPRKDINLLVWNVVQGFWRSSRQQYRWQALS